VFRRTVKEHDLVNGAFEPFATGVNHKCVAEISRADAPSAADPKNILPS
jgi:hypothetical protein